MVGPKAKRKTAEKVVERFEVLRQRACRIFSLHRSTLDYRLKEKADEKIRERMRELAAKYRRFGRLRIHHMLRKMATLS